MIKRTALTVLAAAPPAIIAWIKDVKSWSPFLWLGMVVVVLLTFSLSLLGDVVGTLKDRWTPRLVDMFDEIMQRAVSSYRRKVIRYIRAAYSHLDSKGLSTVGEHTLSLREVFVSLVLDPAAAHMLQSDPIRYGGGGAKAAHDIWYWLRQIQDARTTLAIIGPPGSGKTTLLHHVIYTLMYRKAFLSFGRWRIRSCLPILVNLRDHKDAFDVGNPTLPEVIRYSLTEVQAVEPPRWVERQLERGKVLVLLDGLDEVASDSIRSLISAWVDKQRRQYPLIQFVVTSRPFGYRSNPLGAATVLQVSRFAPAQIERFVTSWYNAVMLRSYAGKRDTARLKAQRESSNLLAKLRSNPALDDLAANPLLLTMITNVHHYKGALPGTRSDLYREVCEVLLGKRHQARGVALDMQASKKQAVLQVLAFTLMNKRVRDTTSIDAAASIDEILQRVAPAVGVDDFLAGVENSSGLIVEHEAGEYSFAHLTFQEYLAAVHMRESGDRVIEQIDIADSWWHETLRLYAAQVDASALVEKCIDKAGGDPRILALAVDCLKEAREIRPLLRRDLEQLVSPVTMEFDSEKRQIAATIRVLFRLRSFVRLSSDSWLSPEPVTSLEYQAFLDASSAHRQFRPDHWRRTGFDRALAEKPALGIPLEGAHAFVAWFEAREQAGGWTYRLPKREEIDTIAGRNLVASAGPGVTITLTVDDEGASAETVIGIVDHSQFAAAVERQLATDRILLESLHIELESLLPQIRLGRIRQNSNVFRDEKLDLANLRVLDDLGPWLDRLAGAGTTAFAEQVDLASRIDAFALSAEIHKVLDDLVRVAGMRATRLHSSVIVHMSVWARLLHGTADMGFHKGGIVDDETNRARLRSISRMTLLLLSHWCDRNSMDAQRVDLHSFRRKMLLLYVQHSIIEAQIESVLTPIQGFHIVRTHS